MLWVQCVLRCPYYCKVNYDKTQESTLGCCGSSVYFDVHYCMVNSSTHHDKTQESTLGCCGSSVYFDVHTIVK